jgi:hypothetical protein
MRELDRPYAPCVVIVIPGRERRERTRNLVRHCNFARALLREIPDQRVKSALSGMTQ